jgi:hypothetical protein
MSSKIGRGMHIRYHVYNLSTTNQVLYITALVNSASMGFSRGNPLVCLVFANLYFVSYTKVAAEIVCAIEPVVT